MARVVKEKEYTERRNGILDVTQRLIYSKGYDRMSIQDILEALQMSKGAFYHYFDSKQALLESLLERMLADVKRLLLPVVEDPSLSCVEKFQVFFTTVANWKAAQKGLVLGMIHTWYADENTIVRQRVRKMMLVEVSPLLTKIIQQGLSEGVLTTAYPEQVSVIIMGLLNDFSATLGELLFVDHLERSELLQSLESTSIVYTDTLERILGMSQGLLHLVDFEMLKEWLRFSFKP